MAHPTRIFQTPQELLDAWNEYKSYQDSQASKWEKVQYVGRDGQRVSDKPPMPYDIDGFFAWYYNTYGKYIHQYFENKDGYYNEFVGIVTHIKAERNDNIKTGTLLGFFNSSMGNRIVGLAEKTDNNTTHNIKVLNIDPLADDTSDHGTKENSETP